MQQPPKAAPSAAEFAPKPMGTTPGTEPSGRPPGRRPRRPRLPLLASIGDLVDGIFGALFDPNTLMIVGYVGAGICLAVSTIGMRQLVLPALAALGPIAPVAGVLAGLGLALAATAIEILPRLPKYFPDAASRLAMKLAMSRSLQPKETADTPTLLPEAKKWARESHKRLFGQAEAASWAMYVVELVSSAIGFGLVSATGLNITVLGLVAVAVATGGFEICLLFAEWMKTLRLDRHQQRTYAIKMLEKQAQAESELG